MTKKNFKNWPKGDLAPPIKTKSTHTPPKPSEVKSRWDELEDKASNAPAGEKILDSCFRLAEMLIEKNISYGNSALDPLRIFSKASALEQLLVRMDDKLSRIARGGSYPGDNDILDFAGYAVLYDAETYEA